MWFQMFPSRKKTLASVLILEFYAITTETETHMNYEALHRIESAIFDQSAHIPFEPVGQYSNFS